MVGCCSGEEGFVLESVENTARVELEIDGSEGNVEVDSDSLFSDVVVDS